MGENKYIIKEPGGRFHLHYWEVWLLNNGKMAEGVCGGIAKYIGIDVSIVRFIWLLLCLVGGIGIWLYLICTIAMPKEQDVKSEDDWR